MHVRKSSSQNEESTESCHLMIFLVKWLCYPKMAMLIMAQHLYFVCPPCVDHVTWYWIIVLYDAKCESPELLSLAAAKRLRVATQFYRGTPAFCKMARLSVAMMAPWCLDFWMRRQTSMPGTWAVSLPSCALEETALGGIWWATCCVASGTSKCLLVCGNAWSWTHDRHEQVDNMKAGWIRDQQRQVKSEVCPPR